MAIEHRLLIIDRSAKKYKQLIGRAGLDNLDIRALETTESAGKWIADSDILMGAPALIAPVLDKARRLCWLQSTWAGVDALTRPLVRSDYELTGVKDVHGPHMREYVMAYILVLERNILQLHANQQRRIWDELSYKPLEKKKIGICGLGSIGRHLARSAAHFGMTVWGYRQTDIHTEGVDRVFVGDRFHEFLSEPDYIVIALPLTDDTHHLFDQRAFAAMKDSAVLINVGRGSLVNERSLIDALNNNLIAGAVLDVFETEPLPPESPLWSMPNVIVTPHISAYSFADEVVDIFNENYRRFATGRPLKYVIDFEKGY